MCIRDSVYAVSEMNDSTAALSSLSLDRETGELRLLNTVPTFGADPCYVATNGPVSYTHLDVYKRQILRTEIKVQINDALHAYLPFLPAVKSSQPHDSVTAVSYTHLRKQA